MSEDEADDIRIRIHVGYRRGGRRVYRVIKDHWLHRAQIFGRRQWSLRRSLWLGYSKMSVRIFVARVVSLSLALFFFPSRAHALSLHVCMCVILVLLCVQAMGSRQPSGRCMVER